MGPDAKQHAVDQVGQSDLLRRLRNDSLLCVNMSAVGDQAPTGRIDQGANTAAKDYVPQDSRVTLHPRIDRHRPTIWEGERERFRVAELTLANSAGC